MFHARRCEAQERQVEEKKNKCCTKDPDVQRAKTRGVLSEHCLPKASADCWGPSSYLSCVAGGGCKCSVSLARAQEEIRVPQGVDMVAKYLVKDEMAFMGEGLLFRFQC